MEHIIPQKLLNKVVNVAVIGAGGTGSQLMTGLARLHQAMISCGHPGGLAVTLFDDDTVSTSNIGRQAFYPSDIDQYKASTIINRINLGFNLRWKSTISRVTKNTDFGSFDLVIGCVDTRAARKEILEAGNGNASYWLDCGNMLDAGQCVLGQFNLIHQWNSSQPRLPHIADLYPDMIDPKLDETDEIPSCSLAEAIEKQSLFINSAVSMWACNMLFEFFRFGKLNYHGNFINLKKGRVAPLAIDLESWKRMGYVPDEFSTLKLAA